MLFQLSLSVLAGHTGALVGRSGAPMANAHDVTMEVDGMFGAACS